MRSRREWWIVGIVVVVAASVRLASLIGEGGPFGYINADEGAYFGASHALVHGVLPYRDFVLLHPPGSTIAYAPAAALGQIVGEANSFAIARLLVVAVGALSAVLAYVTARRAGVVAASVAGLLYAVWFSAVYVERVTLLEPLTNLATLGALALLSRRVISARVAVAAGACVGLATAVKVTNVASLVVVVAWVFLSSGRRRGWQSLAGAVGALVVVTAPVILAAPGDAWRMIVDDQASRGSTGVHLERLAPLLGLLGDTTSEMVIGIVLWLVIAGCAVVVARVYPWARLWVAVLVANLVVMLVAGIYFTHYAAVLAPALVLVIGAAVQVAVTTAATLRGASRAALLAGAGVFLVVLVGIQVRAVLDDDIGRGFPRKAVAEQLAGARCVTADSAVPLILSGVMGRNIDNGCPVVVDFTGQVYETRGEPTYRADNKQFQQFAADYLLSGDRIVLVRQASDLLDDATTELLRSRPILIDSKNLLVLGDGPAAP